ncbi:uncharacterized protein LOC144744177 [Ciona intestinalis]
MSRHGVVNYGRPSSAHVHSTSTSTNFKKPIQPKRPTTAYKEPVRSSAMHYDVTFTPHYNRREERIVPEPPPPRSGGGMAVSGTLTVYPRMENGKLVTMPPYDPLYDPHLADFFAKKFQPPQPPPTRRSWSAGAVRANNISGQSFSRSGRFTTSQSNFNRLGSCSSIVYTVDIVLVLSTKSRKVSSGSKHSKGNVDYKVTVRTGDKKGGGTDARVFIQLVGRRGKVSKWRLFKKSGQSNINTFRFAKGSSHIFKHKGPDIGEIQKVIVEHDGISERDSWFLKPSITTTQPSGGDS